MKFVSILIASMLISSDVVCQWTQTAGPEGGQSYEIFRAGSYLFVNGGSGGIYRSSNKGISWRTVNTGLPVDFVCTAMDVEGTDLYLTTDQGIYHSGNLGNSWQLISGVDIEGSSIEVEGNEVFVGTPAGIYYSANGGVTWTLLNYISELQESPLHLHKFNTTLWAGTGSYLYFSTDNASTWNLSSLIIIVHGIHSSGTDIFVSGNDPSGHFTVNRSSNQGATWDEILQTQGPSSAFMKSGNEIFVSGADRFYYSDNNGVTWRDNPLLPTFTAFSRTSITSIGNDLFISYNDGILFSSDKGITWERRNNGYTNHTINTLTKAAIGIVTCSEQNGIFLSTDQGDQWTAIHDRSRFWPRFVYAYQNSIVMCYDLEVLRSDDNGATWQSILTLIDDIQGAHFVPVPHLAGYEESLVLCTYWGIYYSKDMGDTWSFKSNASLGASRDDLREGFVQQDTVVVLAEDEMFYSTDFCETWQSKKHPDDLRFPLSRMNVSDMIIHPSSILMSTYMGLFKSVDFGASWKKIECIPNTIIYDMEEVNGALVLATYEGVFISRDNTWYSVSNGLEDAKTLSVTVTEQFAYVGTSGKSVWRMPTSEFLNTGEVIDVAGSTVSNPVLVADCSNMTITNPSAAVGIKWYKDGELIPGETGSTLSATDTGRYTVSFENSCDLKMSEAVKIEQSNKEDRLLYNIITANGDGKNEYYFLDEDLIGSRFQVFDRWGGVVYSSEQYFNDWSPDQISAGVYFYSIQNACLGQFKGTLTVVK